LIAKSLLLALSLSLFLGATSCRRDTDRPFVVAIESNPDTLDALHGTDASSERIRQLVFNSLVRKNERFEYVGDLASTIQTSSDNLSTTFQLRPGLTFHNGAQLTSADVKYTLDTLLSSNSRKASPFFEGSGAARKPYISSIETPDQQTVVITLRKPWLQLLANLVPIPILPNGSAAGQKSSPVGSGPFKFVRHDDSQQVIDLESFDKYWEGAPQIKKLRVRAILDANTLQAELRSGRIDLVPPVGHLSPDAFDALRQDPNLKVERFPGANIVYLGFNCQQPPLNNPKVRQAVAYSIDREGLIRDLMRGQARLAHSILPEGSWAYAPGEKYVYNPERARSLLEEAGFRGEPRFSAPIVFKISASSAATRQYAGVMQNKFKEVGLPVEIETLELNSLLDQLRNGQYQMTTSRWVGGNQDPIFLKDLFQTGAAFNRNKYSNKELDQILQRAVDTPDREAAKSLYIQAQQIISQELPMFPLWYPDQIVIALKNVNNISIDPSGDWSFIRKITQQK
jgi:peptide/nickel transport system substrate-binding protein